MQKKLTANTADSMTDLFHDTYIGARNNIIHFLYTAILKRIFFAMDPETVHDAFISIGRFLGSNIVTRYATRLLFHYENPMLAQDIFGIHFENPIGLAAGFDKNARLTGILPEVGFGFEEVGSVTGEPCEGNPKPRLWRLPESRSLVVYYGLMNDGAETISKRLTKKKFAFPVGVSVAKTNSAATVGTEQGIADYVKAYKAFADIGGYMTLNISCPNAFGGEPFTDPQKLDKLLLRIREAGMAKPVFLKLAADLSVREVDAILVVGAKYGISGYICTNLMKNRNTTTLKEANVPDKGGISGKAMQTLSDDMVEHVYHAVRGTGVIVIGCGGVFTAEDAYRKIRRGATLIQLITGMIFEGPQQIGEINRGIASLLRRDGFKNISEAVGVDVK